MESKQIFAFLAMAMVAALGTMAHGAKWVATRLNHPLPMGVNDGLVRMRLCPDGLLNQPVE